MTQIATNMRVTRESARRIRFEPGGTISATDVQEAIEEIAAEFAPAPAPTVIAASGNISTASLSVQTNQSGAIALVVPGSAAWAAVNERFGDPLSIFDISGTASTNNVTLTFTGGELADGLSSLVISTNYGGWRLQPKSGGGWIVV